MENAITKRNIIKPRIWGTIETYLDIDPQETISVNQMRLILKQSIMLLG